MNIKAITGLRRAEDFIIAWDPIPGVQEFSVLVETSTGQIFTPIVIKTSRANLGQLKSMPGSYAVSVSAVNQPSAVARATFSVDAKGIRDFTIVENPKTEETTEETEEVPDLSGASTSGTEEPPPPAPSPSPAPAPADPQKDPKANKPAPEQIPPLTDSPAAPSKDAPNGIDRRMKNLEKDVEATRLWLVKLEESLQYIPAQFQQNAATIASMKEELASLKTQVHEKASKADLIAMENRLTAVIRQASTTLAPKPGEAPKDADKPPTEAPRTENSKVWNPNVLGGILIVLILIGLVALAVCFWKCRGKASAKVADVIPLAPAVSSVVPKMSDQEIIRQAAAIQAQRDREATIAAAEREQAEKYRQFMEDSAKKSRVPPVELVSSNGARATIAGRTPGVLINGNVKIGDNSTVVIGDRGRITIPPHGPPIVITQHVPYAVQALPPVSSYYPQATPNTYVAPQGPICDPPATYAPAPVYAPSYGAYYGGGSYAGSAGYYGGAGCASLPGSQMHAIPNPGFIRVH